MISSKISWIDTWRRYIHSRITFYGNSSYFQSIL